MAEKSRRSQPASWRQHLRTTTMLFGGFAAVASLGFAPLSAQADDADDPYAGVPELEGAPPLYDNLGDYSRSVTTDSEQAQAYFDQGLRLAYGFARPEAAHSFRAAQDHDPGCAMCYWGEAWVLGPYQNNPGGVGAHQDAARAAQEALDRAERTERWEQALIEAMAERYPPGDGEAATASYAAAMAEAAAAHEDDPDVRTLHAESLMMFRPWALYREDGEPHAETSLAVEELEAVLAADLSHSGACHLYIHAVEPWQPQRAEACADLLADGIPGVSHIQHMPSHIYMNIGRYGDGVRSNQMARRMDQAAEHDEAVSVYAAHNTAMLVFAAWMDGQSGVALSAARDLARDYPQEAFHYDLQLARFGRWDELIERTGEPEEGLAAAMWHFAQGLAHLRQDDPQAATDALETIRSIREDTAEEAIYHVVFQHPQRDLLGVAENVLAGEIAAREGRIDAAEDHLREAAKLEDGLPYSEPEPWPIPARHVLGAVLLDAERPEDAEAVYREALEVHPGNGWSLKGLEQSLAAQGKEAEAQQAARDFEQAWERADVWLPASRF
jgi:tetratricopeptide (TPR) repeat protein